MVCTQIFSKTIHECEYPGSVAWGYAGRISLWADTMFWIRLEERRCEAAQRKEAGLFLVGVSLDVNPYCDHVPKEALLSWAGYPATR